MKRLDTAAERSVIEAAQRDPRRFADLYESNFERVYALVVGRIRNRDAAEDLTARSRLESAACRPSVPVNLPDVIGAGEGAE